MRLLARQPQSVDAVERIAHVQGGALWSDVDHETQAYGLATTGGIVGHTGVGGVALGGGIALVVAIMIALWMWSQAPEYRVLFSNYSDRDGGAITASLDQMGVPYKFSEGGSAILVPSEQIHDLRLKLAAQGLPKGGNVGFELMENQKLGVSKFLEQVNYQRSLEGELARSIQSLGSVSAACVRRAPCPVVVIPTPRRPEQHHHAAMSEVPSVPVY